MCFLSLADTRRYLKRGKKVVREDIVIFIDKMITFTPGLSKSYENILEQNYSLFLLLIGKRRLCYYLVDNTVQSINFWVIRTHVSNLIKKEITIFFFYHIGHIFDYSYFDNYVVFGFDCL